uniref:Uncharacterized protein n=1 Tax=Glossina brevipalpis TaxID=37001 RepID=A0A1A9WYG5_9MUSC
MISTKNIKEERADENEVIETKKQMQKIGVEAVENAGKRTALGDLQNRGVRPVCPQLKKESSQSDLTNAKLQNVTKAVKARVDSHWKKLPIAPSKATTKKTNGETVAASSTTAAAAAQRKVLTRSNSVRLGNANGKKVLGLQRHGSADEPLVAEKVKTSTNKLVENKVVVQKVKAEVKTIKSEFEENVIVESTLESRDNELLHKVKPITTQIDSNDVFPVLVKQEPLTTSVKDIKEDSQSYSSELLEGVKNIDENDSENLLLVSEYANDIYDYLFQLESEQPIVNNHLERQTEVNGNMRAVLIDWINEVHLQFRLIAETFQMAVAIIDRYLQIVTNTKRSQLQLVGVTGLFIAAKYEELFPPPIADFVYITDESYTDSQIRKMELKMIKALDCNLSRPLPIHFLRRFSKAAEAEDTQYAMSKYLVELTMIESNMAHYKPSEIAAASLFLSLNLLLGNAKMLALGFNDSFWTTTLQWYSRYRVEHLKPIARKIAVIARNARTVKLKAVYNKYKSTKFQRISIRQEFHGILIDSIIKNEN